MSRDLAGSGGTTRIRVIRRICADPTSTALLLAGPTALELWPGVRRIGEVGGRALVEAELEVAWAEGERVPTAASVRALPPRRTPTSFVTRFAWSGPGLPGTEGTVTLAYAPGADGTPSTHAVLTLDSAGLGGSRLDAAALGVMAEGFLANLAHAAESRSQAA
ncbi:MAG: hypothetical protein WD794_14035 [Mycobacteriales bacterium]